MRWTIPALLATLVAACGDEPAEPPAPAARSAPDRSAAADPPAPDPEPDPEPVPVSELPWRWYQRPPDRDTSGLGDGALHDHALLHYVDDPRRYLISREAGTLVLARENRSPFDPPVDAPAWTRRYEVGAAGDPVVGVEIGGGLFAAAPTERGYVLLSLSAEDGSERWRRVHERDGPGPVQLSFSNDRVIAYVRGPSAAYLHELAAADGELLAARRFGPEVHRAFEPPEGRALRRGRASPEGYRLAREGREGLAVEGPDFRTVLSRGDPFSDHAAFVEVDGTLVVVTFCSAASGASAWGIDLASGEERWVASPGSIGLIGHSAYSNDVRATREGDRVVVYGDESAGRYAGVLDPASGTLLGYEVWRM